MYMPCLIRRAIGQDLGILDSKEPELVLAIYSTMHFTGWSINVQIKERACPWCACETTSQGRANPDEML